MQLTIFLQCYSQAFAADPNHIWGNIVIFAKDQPIPTAPFNGRKVVKWVQGVKANEDVEERTEQAGIVVDRELSIINQGAQVLAELTGRIGAHSRRAEVRKRVGRFCARAAGAGGAQERLADGRGTGRSQRPRGAAAAARSGLG